MNYSFSWNIEEHVMLIINVKKFFVAPSNDEMIHLFKESINSPYESLHFLYKAINANP